MRCRISSPESQEWFGIVCASLKDITTRAQKKLKLTGPLEVYLDDDCETMVADDEYLLRLPENVKLLIRPKECTDAQKPQDFTDSAIKSGLSNSVDAELESLLESLKDNMQKIHTLRIPQLELIGSADADKVSKYLCISCDEVDDLQLAINDMIVAAEERHTIAQFIKPHTDSQSPNKVQPPTA